MAKFTTLEDVANILTAASTINNNNESIQNDFSNTISRDGSTPNQMEADLDLNSNDLLNVRELDIASLRLNGAVVTSVSTVPDWKSAWTTSSTYVLNDIVRESGNAYICLEAHTSGTFATDLSAGKWELFAQKGDAGDGTGDMVGTNNLLDVDSPASSLANIGGQPVDDALTSISGLTLPANKLLYTTGTDTFATSDITIQARQLLDDASYSDMRSTLGLGTTATRDVDNTEDLDTNSTDILSRGGVKTAIENYAATGVGFETDAYWQNMSASRSNNIPYQNTTGHMIFVYAWQSNISVSPTNSSYNSIVSGTSGTDFAYSWVPIMPDHWYKIPNATLVWELRGAP